jgi:ribonuclease G
MKTDRAKHKILPMSPFGLIQITRQRVRPQMNVVVSEKCPTCKGTGEISSSVVLMDEIENRLKYLTHNMNMKGISLHVHPYIAAFLTKGFLKSKRMNWLFKYKKFIKIQAINSFQFGEYKFFNAAGEEINV